MRQRFCFAEVVVFNELNALFFSSRLTFLRHTYRYIAPELYLSHKKPTVIILRAWQ